MSVLRESWGFARAIWRLFLFAGAVALCIGDYGRRRIFRSSDRGQRLEWLRHWCAAILKVLAVSVEVNGPCPQKGLIVSNHLGYLDILVYSAITRSGFVAKRDVRAWPVFGWISTLAGTIYVDRRRKGDTRRASGEMAAALSSGRPLVLFPEGTSSDSRSVLRFHSSLFEAAVETRTPVTASYISYEATDGCVARDVCYWGNMVLAAHMFRLLRTRHVHARIRFAPEAHVFQDRKRAAAATQAEVLSFLRRDSIPECVA